MIIGGFSPSLANGSGLVNLTNDPADDQMPFSQL